MNSNELRLAGYLSILDAVLAIPIIVFSIYATAKGQALLLNVVYLFNLALSVYLILALKRLLFDLEFHGADSILNSFIGITVASTLISLIPPTTTGGGVAAVIGLAILVGMGVISIILGIKLQKCPNNLHGLLKTFSYLLIASGVGFASILLMPVACLLWIVAYIVQALIFFREADAREKVIE